MTDETAIWDNLTGAPLIEPQTKISEQQKSRTPLDDRDEWRTPGYLFDWAALRWGPFDLDLAATPDNAKAARYFTKQYSALTARPWREFGSNAWCNPPYSDVRPWIERAIEESRAGFLSTWLIPAFRGDVYHAELTQRFAAEIVLISPRVAFLTPGGHAKAGNTGGSMFVHFNGREARPDQRATITIETIRKGKP